MLFCDIICLNNSGKDRKSILCIQRQIKIVGVDASYFLEFQDERGNRVKRQTQGIVTGEIVEVKEHIENYNLLSRPGTINKVIQQYHFLVSWKTAGRNNSRTFLESEFLIVPVYCLQQRMGNQSARREVALN